MPSFLAWKSAYAPGRRVERQAVGGEVVDAERVVVGEQRQDVAAPTA